MNGGGSGLGGWCCVDFGGDRRMPLMLLLLLLLMMTMMMTMLGQTVAVLTSSCSYVEQHTVSTARQWSHSLSPFHRPISQWCSLICSPTLLHTVTSSVVVVAVAAVAAAVVAAVAAAIYRHYSTRKNHSYPH